MCVNTVAFGQKLNSCVHVHATLLPLLQVGKDAAVITVPSLTVKTLVEKYAVPKYFGVLSIDTEGSDGMV